MLLVNGRTLGPEALLVRKISSKLLLWLTLCCAAFPQTASRNAPSHRVLPLTPFYDTPTPLPAGPPGQLIRSQSTDDFDLPEGISSWRILYHSRRGNRADVPASAIVLVPDRKSPRGGWPVLAWAHAFTGAARTCAPSLRRNMANGPFLVMYAQLGYAILAPDYAGLGSSVQNAVLDMTSNANDVIYAVAAARTAVPELGSRWIAVGDSMGGIAALSVSELETELKDSNFLGSVAVGQIAELKEFYVGHSGTPPSPALLAYAIKAISPQFDVRDILTDKGMTGYQHVEESCEPGSMGANIPIQQIVKPNWQSNASVTDFFHRNELGQVTAYRPLLILVSDEVGGGSPLADRVVQALCKRGDRVEYTPYSVSSGTLLGSTVRDQMAWIQDRFAGRPAPSNCH
jgi:hypothetical protein